MEGGVKVSFSFCTSSKFVSKSHIFANISKQLQVDNEGVPFTRCLVQNPLPTRGAAGGSVTRPMSLFIASSISTSSIFMDWMSKLRGQFRAVCPGWWHRKQVREV